ncbi:outer membrane beta-barrel protein [Algibacter sp. 2305UL17-15]|uniref:outer membrane beta-barrel protein n=1 Tax=Algibacter sp. 2305UL17-15 TaxID=3231268 RepID=UPI003459C5AE
MKQILLIVLLFFTFISFSQNSKFSLELNYPLPIDDNLIGRNNNGIVDAGLKYSFSNLRLLNIGASLNAGIYKNSKDDRVQPFDVTTYLIQPKIFAELNIKSLTSLHPSIGLGYTFLSANVSDITSFNMGNNASVSSSETESGINFNLGLAYDISKKLFVQAQYDFVKIGVDEDAPDIKYNTNINLFKIGLGYRL